MKSPEGRVASQRKSIKTICPPSATVRFTVISGVTGFILSVAILKQTNLFQGDVVAAAIWIMGLTAGAIFLIDLSWERVFLRDSAGLQKKTDASLGRTATKLLGLIGSFGFIALLYWLFPEYHGSFYDRYYLMLSRVLPACLFFAPIYIYLVDARMVEPHDGYWQVGRLMLFKTNGISHREIWQHLLGWLIKGFFLPLMFIYMCDDLNKVLIRDLGQLSSFQAIYDYIYDYLYFIDVGFVSMGYLSALRLCDTHIRSAEPTLLGWAVALICYEPFWSLIGRQYLAYETGMVWGSWLNGHPVLYTVWGSLILFLVIVYVWSTVAFGARFSNLTHRGIITDGPYRWTKHPAYIAKNLSWWMISIPFMGSGGGVEVMRHCALLLGLNLIYLLRAKTEERHLSSDPLYLAYAQWIDRNGIFGTLRRWLATHLNRYHSAR